MQNWMGQKFLPTQIVAAAICHLDVPCARWDPGHILVPKEACQEIRKGRESSVGGVGNQGKVLRRLLLSAVQQGHVFGSRVDKNCIGVVGKRTAYSTTHTKRALCDNKAVGSNPKIVPRMSPEMSGISDTSQFSDQNKFQGMSFGSP